MHSTSAVTVPVPLWHRSLPLCQGDGHPCCCHAVTQRHLGRLHCTACAACDAHERMSHRPLTPPPCTCPRTKDPAPHLCTHPAQEVAGPEQEQRPPNHHVVVRVVLPILLWLTKARLRHAIILPGRRAEGGVSITAHALPWLDQPRLHDTHTALRLCEANFATSAHKSHGCPSLVCHPWPLHTPCVRSLPP